jgi:hypothetical protein
MNLNAGGWASSVLRLIARLRSDGVNSTTPVTEINGGPISATNADIALVAKGTGATLAQVPDGTIANGNKRGVGATDFQKVRTGSALVASGLYSAILGGASNAATSSGSFVGGGENNTASAGNYAAVCCGLSNTANATQTFVGGGQSNVAAATNAVVCGGSSNSANGTFSCVGGGISNTAGAQYVFVGAGQNNTADGNSSFVGGGAYGTARGISGNHVFPACNSPIASVLGISQAALLILARQTTDATATVLTSDITGAAAYNQVTLKNNSAYSFSGEVIAGVTGAGNSARWTIDGAIKRGANAGTTVMVGTPTVVMTHFDAGAAAWVVAVTANTTLGCITVTVTGAAATTIRWICRIDTTEMTF